MDIDTKIAIIGGSGLTHFDSLDTFERKIIRTPYGEASSPLILGEIDGIKVCFLARHGHGHTIPPHKVNYRANLWALKEVGIKHIIAVGAVGGITKDYTTGCVVIPDQLIDYTMDREHTYYDGHSGHVKHIDFTYPYSPKLRDALINCACHHKMQIKTTGCYAVTQGPRLETAAEVQRYARDGADLVGMTSMPEAALARELNMNYAMINLVVNAASGIEENIISLEDVKKNLSQHMHQVTQLIACSLDTVNALD